METMISVERALNLIDSNIQPMTEVWCPIHQAHGMVLAEDVISPVNMPHFTQSNMDGYAFAYSEDRSEYTVVGEIAAGAHPTITLEKNQAVRIFTGAPLPAGADTVLIQENATLAGNRLIIGDGRPGKGDHVRHIGQDIQAGRRALPKGAILNPASIGLLAAMGIHNIKVIPRPRVGIMVTGNELQMKGGTLQPGKIFESNSYMLQAALQEMHITSKVVHAGDHPGQISEMLRQLLDESDMVMITGGVSVGDYDFTLEACDKCDVAIFFHKIRQKPGKPLLFGMQGNKPVFGLPGNPGSSLTCFYAYGCKAIEKLTCKKKTVQQITAPLAHNYSKPAGMTHLLRAFYDGKEVRLSLGQESFKLATYTASNCIAVLPEKECEISAGTIIDVYVIP